MNPAEGVYDWAALDQEIGFIEAAGLNIYAHVMFPPAWTTGVSHPNHAVPYFCYDPTRPLNVRNDPDCHNPARVPNTVAFDMFVSEIVGRYKNRIRYWGFGTEVHSKVFWQGTPVQFVRDYLRPAYVRVKEIDPGLTVVGPDEDVASSLRELLAYEGTYGRWCDVISFHILRQSLGTQTAADRLDTELKPVWEDYGLGRPVWITELGMPTATTDCLTTTIQGDWLTVVLADIAARPWIQKAFILSLRDTGVTVDDFGLLASDYTPKPAWYSVRSYTGSPAVPSVSYMAEGATGAFFDLDLAIANPTCQPAPLTISYLRADGTTVNDTRTVAGLSRLTVRVNDVANMGNTAASSVVTSTSGVPLVAERTMFWDRNYYGGHGGSAVGTPSTTWYFAEGSQGFFDTYALLANANNAPADVTITFLREGEPPVVRTYRVGPTSRFNVYAGDDPALRGRSFSMAISSTLPIIGERAMYFGTSRFWDAGHESAGVTVPATSWFHAEGATGPFFDTYILIGNPQTTPANVTLTFLLDTGTVITKTYQVGPQNRLTVDVEAQDPRLANAAVSTTVSADVPIISERAMYWPGPFTTWAEAHNSFGVTSTGTKWVLAEGRVGAAQGFETYILVANTGSTTAEIRVTYLRTASNGPPITKTYRVGPTSRFNIHVNGAVAELANEHFGAIIESTNGAPIVVERAMYWNALGQTWAGGTNVTAVKLRD